MDRERGFTLIELVVAAVLISIAVGMVGAAFISALGGSGGSRASGVSDAAITRTTDALGDDVARAVTQDREANKLRDPVDLRDAVAHNMHAISSDPADAGARLDFDEVISATPTELRLRVRDRCITWRASSSASGDFTVRRMVDPAGSCGGGSTSDQVFLHAPAAATGIVRNPFGYHLICNPATCPGSGAAGSTPCRPWAVSTVQPAQRRWVVAVTATFHAVNQEGRSVATSDGSVAATIRSRDTESYRRALGC